MVNHPAHLILASSSPRRQALLRQIGIYFKVCPVEIDETPFLNESPEHYVKRMATEKSAACLHHMDLTLPILAADTAVIAAGNILGKPKDFAHARQMLTTLSGTTHFVYSAVLVMGKRQDIALSITEVTFKNLTAKEIAAYWESGEPQDKAGAYAIQGYGAIFIKSISGSYSGVMGLPLYETAQLLRQQGITITNE